MKRTTKKTPVLCDVSQNNTAGSGASPAGPFTIGPTDTIEVYGRALYPYRVGRICSIYARVSAINTATKLTFAFTTGTQGESVIKYVVDKTINTDFGDNTVGTVFVDADSIFGDVSTSIPTDANGNLYMFIVTDAGTCDIDTLVITFDQP